MSNPLFNEMITKNGNINGNFANNMQKGNLFSQFQQFKNTFQGDPKQQVQHLLNSGQMSQSDFERLSKMATQFQKMLGI